MEFGESHTRISEDCYLVKKNQNEAVIENYLWISFKTCVTRNSNHMMGGVCIQAGKKHKKFLDISKWRNYLENNCLIDSVRKICCSNIVTTQKDDWEASQRSHQIGTKLERPATQNATVTIKSDKPTERKREKGNLIALYSASKGVEKVLRDYLFEWNTGGLWENWGKQTIVQMSIDQSCYTISDIWSGLDKDIVHTRAVDRDQTEWIQLSSFYVRTRQTHTHSFDNPMASFWSATL